MDNTIGPEEFLLSLKFQNSLPNAPSGPFLKNIQVKHSFEEFPEYRTSTLEKSYIWQPHFGPDMGIELDLVDQDAILAQDKGGVLDQSDLRYLTGNANKGRGKTKQIDQDNKPWWLRNTTYMENNLYNVTKIKAKTAEAGVSFAAQQPELDYNVDMLSTDFINDSFDAVSRTVNSLIAKNASKKLLRDMSLVPLVAGSAGSVPFIEKLHSLVRFDEDPMVTANGSVKSAEEEHSSASSSASKKRKVDAGLITNLRKSMKSSELRSEVIEVSLVSPLVAHDEKDEEEKEGDAAEEVYGWVKDYRMNVQHIQLSDSFLFVLPTTTSDNSSEEATVTEQNVQYFPIRARVDMKKMNPEDSRPHECRVIRE